MPGWTLVDTHPTQGRVFQRPLDITELCFLWDGFFNGTADSLHPTVLETHIYFPRPTLQGVATDSKADDSSGFASEPHFVVREHDLADATSSLGRGPRPPSEELLVQLHVFRGAGAEKTDALHLMILMAHCVINGWDSDQNVRAMLVGYARERWRARAWPGSIGGEADDGDSLGGSRTWASVLAQSGNMTVAEGNRDRDISTEDENDIGRHTLPCRLTRSTPHTAARPDVVSTSLTPTQGAAVIAHCRLHAITFGNAYSRSQIVMARVLYRRYLRGVNSEEKWTYPKGQQINGGPLSPRRYLDKAQFENGGGEFILLIIKIHLPAPIHDARFSDGTIQIGLVGWFTPVLGPPHV
ncbi:hypothetical protein L210DRAFT_3649304 [Boletus edulis BED1]|uniref:Uncharacterized protein n=1 Tax=Boletus edulis BED1 TaxID=1328754 RepID=A0AAD4BM99_BOLED|nr:hypothetical protein L210DRAFT_3649304 [Boletus edulis BED1]